MNAGVMLALTFETLIGRFAVRYLTVLGKTIEATTVSLKYFFTFREVCHTVTVPRLVSLTAVAAAWFPLLHGFLLSLRRKQARSCRQI